MNMSLLTNTEKKTVTSNRVHTYAYTTTNELKKIEPWNGLGSYYL